MMREPDLGGEEGWEEFQPLWYGQERSFISGEEAGDRLRIRYFLRQEDQTLVARVWFGPGSEGPPRHAHGGSIASVLDEAMGAAAWMAGHMVVAARITITFRRMVPLGTIATVETVIQGVEGRKVATQSRLVDGRGEVLAEGEGLFIIIGMERFGEFLAEGGGG